MHTTEYSDVIDGKDRVKMNSSQVAEVDAKTVLVLENVKSFLVCHVCNLFRHRCSCLSMDLICFDREQAEKSSTKSEQSVPGSLCN